MTARTSSALAIHGGVPIRSPEKAWPSWPMFDETERRALMEVFESGKWWFGERVAGFERGYAVFQDARECISCSSGTAALEVCMQALGIKPRDEVLVPAFTFIATASAVARMGGIPVFVDIDESWCMNPDLLEAAITPRTRAIVPVHFGGRVCDMDRINAIAAKHDLKVIEDACHSWGSKWNGKGTGALGLGGVFSFQVSKNITAGEGGAIVTDNMEFAEFCRSTVNCGRGSDGVWYGHVRVGTNARLTEFQGAILSAQLSRLEAQTLQRERNATFLNDALGGIEGIIPQPGDGRITRRAYHIYCVRIEPKQFGCSRERFVEAAKAEGLPIGAGYALPLYRQPAFAEGPHAARYAACRCPVTEDLCSTSGMWFIHSVLLGNEADMQDIASVFVKIRDNVSTLRG